MWGITQARTMDAALDEISRLQHERETALAELVKLGKRFPGLEQNRHYNLACLALQ